MYPPYIDNNNDMYVWFEKRKEKKKPRDRTICPFSFHFTDRILSDKGPRDLTCIQNTHVMRYLNAAMNTNDCVRNYAKRYSTDNLTIVYLSAYNCTTWTRRVLLVILLSYQTFCFNTRRAF